MRDVEQRNLTTAVAYRYTINLYNHELKQCMPFDEGGKIVMGFTNSTSKSGRFLAFTATSNLAIACVSQTFAQGNQANGDEASAIANARLTLKNEDAGWEVAAAVTRKSSDRNGQNKSPLASLSSKRRLLSFVT
jgi:hypothetical protein